MVSSARYEELRIRLEQGREAGSYRVVASALGAEASGTFALPFSSVELENFVLKLGRTRRGVRRMESPEMQLARTFGSRLFEALFQGGVRDLYRHASSEASEANHGLRITLALSGAPDLMQVPWEYLYDRPDFLSISTWTPVVRYLDLAKPPRPLQLAFPLRILGMISSPSEVEPLDVQAERTRVEAALGALVGAGVVTIDWVDEPTLLGLTRQLRKADYHVFHYIGHGGFDPEARDGVLLFEDGQRRGKPVTGRQLGDILRDERTLRLAVLNACEGARASVDDPFSGVATSLIEREIPAVIGMQFEITDTAAIVFASEFYSVLADGQPVDTAVSEARKSIYALGNDIEWGTPVLFMRVADGRLFEIPSHAPVPRVDPEVLLQEAAAAGAVAPATERTIEPADQEAAAERERLERVQAEAAEREQERLAAESAEWERRRREQERLSAEAAKASERERQRREQERLAAEAAEWERQRREQERLAALAAPATGHAADRPAGAAITTEETATTVTRRSVTGRPVGADVLPRPVSRPRETRGRSSVGAGTALSLLLVLVGVGVLAFLVMSPPGPVPGASPTTPPGRTRTTQPARPTPPPANAVAPANVFNQPQAEAIATLEAQGFSALRLVSVCSGSVPAGHLREIVLDDGSNAQTETEVLDENGPLLAVPLDTPLVVKIGNGSPCN